jgi:hypothetical protein
MITFERGISQTRDGALVRRGKLGEYSIELDLTEQVLRLDVADEQTEPGLNSSPGFEPLLRPSLAGVREDFVSAAMLAQKAKQFDDGLYAAVELAAQRGTDRFAGKQRLLELLAAELTEGQAGQPGEVVLAAAELGGLTPPLAASIAPSVKQRVQAFLLEDLKSKPLAFYTWSPELKAIFQQDRMLQSRLKGSADIATLARLLHANPRARASYERHLRLMSGLSNPFAATEPSLRDAFDQGPPDGPDSGVCFFPPSRARETDLAKRLFQGRSIPAGYSLMDDLIARIRAGKIDLTPTGASGWYDYQTWALEPLIVPEGAAEASHLDLGGGYRRHLEALFKGLLTLTRETHIKQVEASMRLGWVDSSIPIEPLLSLEPVATYYLRRAQAYAFVRTVLEAAFEAGGLRGMQRLTADGPVEPDLDAELSFMERLFLGAYVTAMRELGIDPGATDRETAAAATYAQWAQCCGEDRDLAQDARAMVPLFFDIERRKTRVWLFLGWSEKTLDVAFFHRPRLAVFDDKGRPVSLPRKTLRFVPCSKPLFYPVMVETYVDRILNRKEFQRHCDEFRTPGRIVDALH